jgi:hypothetical protein
MVSFLKDWHFDIREKGESMNANRSMMILFILLAAPSIVRISADEIGKTSKTVGSVLREPLPAEELRLAENDGEFIVTGPTFTYHVQKSTGAINAIRVVRDGQTVIETNDPADIQIDQYRLASDQNSVKSTVVSEGTDKVVLKVEGVLRDPVKRGPDIDIVVLYTFFNDGVVVSEVKLKPGADLLVEKAIVYQLPANGRFQNYLHKRRDENGINPATGSLPASGKAIRWNTLTSCLQVFSPTAALAIFTDGGAIHLSQPELDTATVEVIGKKQGLTQIALAQYLVHVASGDKPYLLKAGEEFGFRVGISVTPNRLPHPRMHDLRMFIWIGDAKYPYPTDEEICDVAKLGFTLFQLHRAGTAGEPRPPAGEAERVINKVHETGMLFLWTENPDLLYASAPGVQKLQAEGKWSLWQGFNYNGHYTANMDPYCDLVATCLASPNGQAEYRLANISRMMDQTPVDGIYLDDNLAYSNCTLWKEHGHPRQVYDCLIELHEMNWRRRELMRTRCPHAVLVSHCASALILPVICDFDVQYYAENYTFDSVENYWNYYGLIRSIPSQGMICPGSKDPVRCPAAIAYNYDLLTGGGQYSQFDWRLYPKKFPYALGVSERELVYVKSYNLAQVYFGMYESIPYCFADSTDLFATTTSSTYASIYRNQVWNDWLIPIANMSRQAQETSLEIRSPETLGIVSDKEILLFDVHQRIARKFKGSDLQQGFRQLSIPGESLRLFYLRQQPTDVPFHLWGGKRISESWDGTMRKLTFTIHGPAGLQDTIFIGGATFGIRQVVVAGKPAVFSFDPDQGLAHGSVTFTASPLKVEVLCSPDGVNGLPEKTAPRDPLTSP